MRPLFLLVILSVLYGCKPVANDKQTAFNFDEACRQVALAENIPGQSYAITHKQKDVYDLDITYLGSVKTNGDTLIKFVSMVRQFGLYKDSPRANAHVFLYNNHNKPLGYYYVGGADDVPDRVAGKSLVFAYTYGECSRATAINFADSIPREIFVACNEKGGNVWKLMQGFPE